ncbi:hypothetical protein NFI95_12710 [Acetobacteraceae bacterium KSS8]|uniref:Uncharacterized protein n=1 Tax=Endosaccharibacter trunci TaxID=2812733 RepID=A0ABT1WBV6_9PROT|nr:hypothetical protein [Acetobacteraceae bacterium KSS8]
METSDITETIDDQADMHLFPVLSKFCLLIVVCFACVPVSLALGQPAFNKTGDARFRNLTAQAITSTTTVDGISLGTLKGLAVGALPRSGGQLTGSMTANVNLGSTASTFGLGSSVIADGSGINGPRYAQFGGSLTAIKRGWSDPSATQGVGEVDGLSILVRQGGLGSDAGGILLNVQNTGLGFLAMSEMASTSVDVNTSQIKDGIDIQEGVIDELNNNKIGTVYNMIYGVGTNAILIQNDQNASWQNVLRYTQDGNLKLLIDGNGVITATGLDISAAELHSGSEMHSGISTFQSLRLVSTPIISSDGTYSLTASSCGTLVRDLTAAPHTITIPSGLPPGCHIEVVQAGANGTITFASGSLTLEQVGSGQLSHTTKGQYAHVTIIVDSTTSVLITGDLN